MGLLDDFTRGLGLFGSAVSGDTAPLQAAAGNTATNFNRGVQQLRENAPANVANMANNFAGDFSRGLGVARDNPGALRDALAHSAGEMARQPITSAENLGAAIGNAASGRGTWEDALMAAPDAAANGLMATALVRRGAGSLSQMLPGRAELRLPTGYSMAEVRPGAGGLQTANLQGVANGDIARVRQVAEAVNDFERQGGGVAGGHAGANYPDLRSVVVSDPRMAPHELSHANVAAQAGGDLGALPADLHLAAALQRSPVGMVRGLGVMGEEMGAYSRNPVGGGGVWDYLNHPMPNYAADIAEHSPLVASLYNSRLVPRVATGVRRLTDAATAGGAGAAVLGAAAQANR